VALDGRELSFLVNRTLVVDIAFAGIDPISFGAAASQIVAQGLGLLGAYVATDGTFVVTGAGGGLESLLQLVSGDAAPQLGLVVGSEAAGKEAWLHLVPGQSEYRFTDPFGDSRFFYKTRFRNSSTNAVSAFSQVFTSASRLGISPSSLITGQVSLVQVNGKPLAFQEVRIHTEFNGTTVGGKVLAGGDVVRCTDVNGYVEFLLLRGQLLTVSLPGTDLYRQITVPTDPSLTTFNLMDPSIAGEDVFKVAVPNLVYAERRSL
jgi:hypothetical protein